MFHNRAVIEWIKVYLFDEYPDLRIEDYLIESIFLGVLDYIQAGMEAEEDISIPSLGKFIIKKKENKYGNMQYYIKFKASRHLVLNLRQQKGTLTEAEKRDILKKREFIQQMWENKQARLEKAAQRKEGKRFMSPTMSEILRARQNKSTAKLEVPIEPVE